MEARADEIRVEAEILVPPIMRLETDPNILLLPVPTATDFARGYVEIVEPVTLTVSSNTGWNLYARSAGENTEVGPRAAERPGRLLWRADVGGFSDMREEWILIGSGESCAGGTQVSLSLRVPLDWSATSPGDYEVCVEYKLTPAHR